MLSLLLLDLKHYAILHLRSHLTKTSKIKTQMLNAQVSRLNEWASGQCINALFISPFVHLFIASEGGV